MWCCCFCYLYYFQQRFKGRLVANQHFYCTANRTNSCPSACFARKKRPHLKTYQQMGYLFNLLFLIKECCGHSFECSPNILSTLCSPSLFLIIIKWNETKRCSKYAIVISINEIRDANALRTIIYQIAMKIARRRRQKKKKLELFYYGKYSIIISMWKWNWKLGIEKHKKTLACSSSMQMHS